MLGSLAWIFTLIQGGAGSVVRVGVGVNVIVGVGVRNGVRVGLGVGLAGMRVAVELSWMAGISVGVMEAVADWVPDGNPALSGVPVKRVPVAEGMLVTVGLAWPASGVPAGVRVGVPVAVASPGYGVPAGVTVAVAWPG